MDSSKPTRLLYKLLAGLIYTDIELRPRHELENYAEHICATIGEAVDPTRLLSNMISNEVIIFDRTDKNGVSWYRHNLPKTLAHDYQRDNQRTP